MKKKVKFDDNNYYKVLMFMLSIFFLLIFIVSFPQNNTNIRIMTVILAISFLMLAFNASKIGLTFNYRKKIIYIYVPFGHGYCKFKMDEIREIRLIEIYKERKKYYFSTFTKSELTLGIYKEPKYVYRNGKIFNIEITMKKGEVHTIFYGMLYKSRSAERVKKQEDKINEAIQLFIEKRLKTRHK